MRVAFVHRGELSTFKARDLAGLRAAGHDVREVAYRGARDAALVARETRAADAVFAWFADIHATIAIAAAPRRVPVIVVVGGYEVEGFPEIPYGTFATADALTRAAVKRVLTRADVLLPVSERTRAALMSRAKPRGRVRVVPNGVDPAAFRAGAKEPLVLTVGKFLDFPTARVKGLPDFVEAARRLRTAPFAIVGPVAPAALASLGPLPPNVQLAGETTPEDLAAWYAKAHVYTQLSLHESFGVALAEAMSAECVPVATTAGALPEVVGDAGYLVEPGNAAEAASAIRRALDAPAAAGARARARIVERFTLARRGKAIEDVLAEARAW